jgi:hypothetical protein
VPTAAARQKHATMYRPASSWIRLTPTIFQPFNLVCTATVGRLSTRNTSPAFLEVAVCGTIEPAKLRRSKVARTPNSKPALTTKFKSNLGDDGRYMLNQGDMSRLSAVIEKIAPALWALETGEAAGLSLRRHNLGPSENCNNRLSSLRSAVG